jgi:uncharacterized protein with HEPN domain
LWWNNITINSENSWIQNRLYLRIPKYGILKHIQSIYLLFCVVVKRGLLSEEREFQGFENKILRRVFVCTIAKLMGRLAYYTTINSHLYRSASIIVRIVKSRRSISLVGYVARSLTQEMQNFYKNVKWKWWLGTPRSKLVDNIKMDLREIGCEDGRWMELAQDRVQWRAFVLAVLNLRVLLPES